MYRICTGHLSKELFENRQMIFVSGPRQVGKTTLANQLLQNTTGSYFNWDNSDHRQTLLSGMEAIAEKAKLNQLVSEKPLIVFDELHKFRDWKNWLKGFFDTYENKVNILVTGSARMDIFRKGGDSLMGRYFHYRLHPLSLFECANVKPTNSILQKIQKPKSSSLSQLLSFGGFPEPFLKADNQFSNRWQKMRSHQLIFEDIRDATQVREIAQLEILTNLLAQQSGQVVRYNTLANQIRVSVDTIRRWFDVLESFYFCFRVRPWFNNISTALRKDPKTYLWDWSQLKDKGARHENLIASHLLKAVHWWNDRGFGDFDLFYLRTKDRKEVDFLITQNGSPWFLVEVKSSVNQPISKHLAWAQEKTKARHAFQVCMDLPFVNGDCFELETPSKIPVESFLMRLI